MKGWGYVAAAILAPLLSAATLGTPADPKKPSTEEPVLRATLPQWQVEAQTLAAAGRFSDARDRLDRQLAVEKSAGRRSLLHYFRSQLDVALDDRPAFRSDVEAAARLTSMPHFLLPELILQASAFDERAAMALMPSFAGLHAKTADGLPSSLVGHLLQALHQAGRQNAYEELILALADVSYRPAILPEEILEKAAEVSMQRGKINRALEHARQLRERDGLIDVLTDRRFKLLWPELERSGGPRLENLARNRLRTARIDFERAPGELQTRLGLMRAYMDLGMFADAERLGRVVGKTGDELMALDEIGGFVVDTHASLLYRLEGIEAADRRRAALVATWTPERAWVINMAINRIGLLFDAHQYERVLNLLDDQRLGLEVHSSPYAKQLVRVLRMGSLIGLNRTAEAMALVPDIRAHAEDAPTATLEALLLAGKDAEAESLALTWLQRPDFRSAVVQLVRVTDSSSTDDPLAQKVHTRFRARPDLMRAFQQHGRDLPVQLRRTD